MKNTFGNALGLTIFGESHGAAVGAVLDGLAAGLPVDEAYIAERMDRRRARGDGLSTARTEPDVVEFLSGVVNGHTTGTPITMMIRNTNTRSGDYAKTADLLRPGHADYTAYAKYEGWQDARGGGHFSGRITAASVAAGSICEHILAQRGIKVYTHIARCAGVEDAPLSSSAGLIMAEPQPGHFALLDPEKEAPMQAAIRAAGAEGDSVGGILETVITGVPAGIGEPFFDSVESEIAHLAFAIPAVKGIEFGAGFAFADLRGSQANDPFTMRDGKVVTATNKNGGINGGIANGMPIVFRTAVKPTPSIYKEQDTVDYIAKADAKLQIKAGTTPALVPRCCCGAEHPGSICRAGPADRALRYAGAKVIQLKQTERKRNMEYGLIGAKLGHSYSKIIHEAVCGYSYELHPLPTEEEAHAFMQAKAFKAINVTIPYKKLVIPYCDEVEPRAAAIGAVNTVVNRDGKLYGYNTDYTGFAYLARCHGVKFAGAVVLVLGTGGTHNTVTAVCQDAGAKQVLTASRTGKDGAPDL